MSRTAGRGLMAPLGSFMGAWALRERASRRRGAERELRSEAGHRRTSTDRAWASRPSARASVVMAGASLRRAGCGQFLDGDDFQVVGDGEASAQAGGAAGGQHVIGAGGVVAGGFGTVRADEDAAGVTDFGEQRRVGNAQVFGREAVGDLDGFIERAHQDDGGVLGDRFARDGGGGERGQLALDFSGDGGGQALGGGEQDGGGVHIVLGLRQHVGGEVARIAFGGDDQDLGGAGDEIDADFAGEQFLGGGDVDVAGADDAVGARHGARAEGEGRDGLRAAHLKDVTHAQQGRGAEDFGDRLWGRRCRCSARRRPAPESRSSSRWRAADSGPPECTRPRYRAGARSDRVSCPA